VLLLKPGSRPQTPTLGKGSTEKRKKTVVAHHRKFMLGSKLSGPEGVQLRRIECRSVPNRLISIFSFPSHKLLQLLQSHLAFCYSANLGPLQLCQLSSKRQDHVLQNWGKRWCRRQSRRSDPLLLCIIPLVGVIILSLA
jgi:hypothetical protein